MTTIRNKEFINIEYFDFVKIILLILFTFKSFPFIIEPRIWAEEGDVYLKDSILTGINSILHTHQGYYSIIPSLTLFFASLFNFKFIPYFTIAVSLTFFILLFLLIDKINNDKYDKNFKSLIIISFFVILNSIQEIFLNVITLQFITPLILCILSFYDFTKLSKLKFRFILFIIAVCTLNGPTNIFIVPLLIIKLLRSNHKSEAVFIALLLTTSITSIFITPPSDSQVSAAIRIKSNIIQILDQMHNCKFKSIIIDNIYLIIIPIFFIWRKRINQDNLQIAILTLIYGMFFQLTKAVGGGERYSAIVYCLMVLAFTLLFLQNRTAIFSICLVTIFYFGRGFLKTNYSYDKDIKPWSSEYLNLNNNRKAEIHPKGWYLSLKKQ